MKTKFGLAKTAETNDVRDKRYRAHRYLKNSEGGGKFKVNPHGKAVQIISNNITEVEKKHLNYLISRGYCVSDSIFKN